MLALNKRNNNQICDWKYTKEIWFLLRNLLMRKFHLPCKRQQQRVAKRNSPVKTAFYGGCVDGGEIQKTNSQGS